MSIKIRVTGKPEELKRFLQKMQESFILQSFSSLHQNRNSILYRQYLEIATYDSNEKGEIKNV